MGKFIIKKSTNGQYYFNLKAGNGETILTSEMYASKNGVQAGISSVKANATLDGRYERKKTAVGQFYFVLKAGNGEPIGRSETYTSSGSMEVGIASVKANAPAASSEDQTV